MPKKTAKKPTKKVAAKKSVRRTTTTSMPMSSQTSSVSSFRADQDAFHKQHPHANTLIGLFVFAFCMLVVIYIFSGAMM